MGIARGAEIESLAESLIRSYGTRVPVPPLSLAGGRLSIEDAYAVQSAQLDRWIADGRRVRGYKVGLTSAAMQHQLGVDQPDFGVLLADMCHDDGARLDASQLISPRVEPEISFVLGKPLTGPGLELDDVVDAVAAVLPALEIIDSRIENWNITLGDTIADNASSSGVVLGTSRLPLDEVDVAATEAVMSVNGTEVGRGTGAAVLGSPVNAVLWLANQLGAWGVTLEAGAIVLPGSVCAAHPVRAGDEVVADFGRLGTVSVTFEEGAS